MAAPLDTDALPFGIAGKVLGGVWRVRLPLDLQQDHINVWVIEDGPDISIVDTGVGTKRTCALWQQLLQEQFPNRALRRVICTHWHPDHMGCAAFLVERAMQDLWITEREFAAARRVAGPGHAQHMEIEAEFLRVTGCDHRIADRIMNRAGYLQRVFLPPPETCRRFVCGDEIAIGGDRWLTVLGEGHSPEHAALYSVARNVLIGGDMVLPGITTFVGIDPGDGLDADPLGAYLDSLERLRMLPDDILVLPSHGEPFVGLEKRIGELEAKHEARLGRVLDSLEGAMSPADLVQALASQDLSDSQLYMGLRSALAGLNYHTRRGAVSSWQEGDVLYYARS